MPSEQSIIHPSLPLIFPLAELSNGNKESKDADAAWHFYSHSVRRTPSDLRLHTRRVFCAMQHKDASFLPGSLHDLFFILKDAGENLRIRLLKAAIPYLSKQDVLYFAMWIKIGINKGLGYKWIQGSVLSDGLFGPDQDLITIKKNRQNQNELTPLEEARYCMEYGQLEQAENTLLEALEIDTENTTLQEELEYLSHYTKSRQIQPEKEVDIGKFKNDFRQAKR